MTLLRDTTPEQGRLAGAIMLSLLFCGLALAVSHGIIQHSFSLDTNYCQYAQGVLFSRGVIHGDGASFHGLAVHLNCMIDPFRTGYASKYPPGYSALIAAMLPLRAVPLINPLCGALTLLLTLLIVHRHYKGSTTPFWTAALSFTSVYLLHMSAESWNHPSALLACTVMVWAAFRDRSRAVSSSIAMILALLFCALTRPFSALGMSLFLLCVAIHRSRSPGGDATSSRRLIATTTVGLTFGLIALGLYNHALTGDFLTSGYESLHGPAHNPGFHIDPYGRDFSVWVSLQDLFARWRSMNEWLFMWPIPSLTLIGVWAVALKKWRSFDGVCVLWIALQSLIYCFMWSAGQVQFGPRFLYEAMPAILILSARGISILEEALGSTMRARIILSATVVVLSAVGFSRYLSWVERLH